MITTAMDYARLLTRKTHQIDRQLVNSFLRGKVVAVTGAGGTIGSALSNLTDTFDIERLILVERAEPALVRVENAINHPCRGYATDVTREKAIRQVFEYEEPDVVFHTAAHKHVPKTEEDPDEAILNNYTGLKYAALAASKSGCETFVYISTDKAVQPISTLGLTKALGEKYMRWINARSDCDFASVRFGNVIGSSGSVLEVWERQANSLEPLTITDPEMTRYFMTIEEAAGLTLSAASICDGGEVFVLDMGEPITIMDLMQRFAAMYGEKLTYRTIKTRAGEKQDERLYTEDEHEEPSGIDGVSKAIRC
jgi:FlaA1/EpsC-like NDP-sugar epimerase